MHIVQVGHILVDARNDQMVRVVALGDQGGALVNPATEGIMYANNTYRVWVADLVSV